MKQTNSNLTKGALSSTTITTTMKKQQQEQSIIITTIQQQAKIEKEKLLVCGSFSHLVVRHAVHDIIAIAQDKLQQNRLIKKHLNNFSCQFAQTYINENIDIHLFNGEQKRLIHQQTQPQNISGDNLCPASTSVQQKCKTIDEVISLPGTINNQTVGRLTRNMSTISKISRNTNNNNRNQSNESIINNNNNSNSNNKKVPKTYEFIKLDEKTLSNTMKENSLIITNDPYIQELRRIKQAKPKIQLKTQQEKRSNTLRQKIKLQDKFSYDFTGDILKIKLKQQPKSTLLTAQIKTVQNQGATNRPYQSFVKSTPTSIENPNLKRDKGKKLPSTRQPEVEFSNVMSLVQNFQIKQGAKFIHNKATLEKKKKQPSLIEIKKSLSLNKISRSQYARLKSIDSNQNNNINKTLLLKSSMPPSLPSIKSTTSPQQQTKNQQNNSTYNNIRQTNVYQSINSDRTQIRSLPKHTNIKRNNNKLLLHTERSSQRVSVESQQLSEILVDDRFDIKVGGMDSVRFQQQNQIVKQNNSHLQALSPRDIANLHYIKSGGTVGKLQLPKISYRLNDLPSSKNLKLPNSILQSKSKIKIRRNQNQFQRLKKHFDDKLRV